MQAALFNIVESAKFGTSKNCQIVSIFYLDKRGRANNWDKKEKTCITKKGQKGQTIFRQDL